jgi:2-desacetyl-2-hydroxyethyl bacteriochlorophyllide A dehydrogenase
MINCNQLFFIQPGQVEIRSSSLPPPEAGQILVQTCHSAISPGTEMLIYRGQFPDQLAVDDSIASLSGLFSYPLQYGYCAVGEVIETGEEVGPAWLGRKVFAFQPHASHFLCKPADVLIIPGDLSLEQAVFLPNMETAVNLVQDGTPRLGENVIIYGQGIVGLLTTALLMRFPLHQLITLDQLEKRRQASLEAGVTASFDPRDPHSFEQISTLMPDGADLVVEVSGSPAALESAIATTGYSGRIVVGSWYGQKRAHLDLGGHFHRNRIQLVSSQVSTIAPELSGRWNKNRRFEMAWEMIRKVQPQRWITHRFPFSQAPQAYQLLDQYPDQVIQVVFSYE